MPVDVGVLGKGRRRVVALADGRTSGPGYPAELLPVAAAGGQLVRSTGTAVADLR